MKLAIKTRDNVREDYLYEVHKSPCAHLRRDSLQAFVSDKYENAEDFIKADMENDIARKDYRIMPCVK